MYALCRLQESLQCLLSADRLSRPLKTQLKVSTAFKDFTNPDSERKTHLTASTTMEPHQNLPSVLSNEGLTSTTLFSRIRPSSNSNFPTPLSDILLPQSTQRIVVAAAAVGPEAQVAQCTEPAYPYPNCHYVSINEMWRDLIHSPWTALALASLLVLLLGRLFVVLVLRGAERRRQARGRRAAGLLGGRGMGDDNGGRERAGEQVDLSAARPQDAPGSEEHLRAGSA